MGTMCGARVLGRDGELGSLEAGKLADIALWRLDTLPHVDIFDPLAALVLGAGAGWASSASPDVAPGGRCDALFMFAASSVKLKLNTLFYEPLDIIYTPLTPKSENPWARLYGSYR